MLTRVATFALSDQMITDSLRTQARMAQLQQQEATGVISTDFGGIGATSKRVIDLQVSVDRAQSYIDAATTANSRAQVMYSACGSMSDLLTQFRSLLTGATDSATTDTTSVTESAQEMMQEFASLLNTQYDGRYVFGGAKTGQTPVDISDPPYAVATSPSSADTSYYRGDQEAASVRVSDQQVIDYGVTADGTGFEQALRAFNLVANTSPLDTATLNEALNLTVNAVSGVSAAQTRLSLASAAMERAISYQTEYQDDAKSLGTDLNGVDVAAVTAQETTYQTQLEASYSAIAKIQGLSLVSYLR
jgi:flagellar hook-associated protein 3 FlgL